MHITARNIQLCASHVLTGIEAMPTPNECFVRVATMDSSHTK